MKTQAKLILLVLLVSTTVCQKFIMSSDERVEITRTDTFSGSPRSGSGDNGGTGGGRGGSGGRGGRGNGGQDGPGDNQGRRDRVQILGGGGGISSYSAQQYIPQPVPKFEGIGTGTEPIYARIEQPSGEAIALRAQMSAGLRSGSAQPVGFSNTNSRVQNSLASSKWISGTRLGTKKVIYWTPCFWNSCPDGEYTFDIQATCEFTVYLVDEWGNIVDTIGSGYGWWPVSFTFRTTCGRHRIKIVLNCPCGCAHVRFNLYQDQSNCFRCPNNVYHTYNPQTCECQCASTCTDCKFTQSWIGYPTCACACTREEKCPEGQYFDRKECRCKCLPTCCSSGCGSGC